LSNAKTKLQLAFAACYILLNALYWISSALNPLKHHWDHNYDVKKYNILPPNALHSEPGRVRRANDSDPFEQIPKHRKRALYQWQNKFRADHSRHQQHAESLRNRVIPQKKSTFTTALWTAIALTRSVEWLKGGTNIAPVNEAWAQWIAEAGKRARYQPLYEVVEQIMSRKLHHLRPLKPPTEIDGVRPDIDGVMLPGWPDYNHRLTELLSIYRKKTGRRPSKWPRLETVKKLGRFLDEQEKVEKQRKRDSLESARLVREKFVNQQPVANTTAQTAKGAIITTGAA
jgi:hypothetical protein